MPKDRVVVGIDIGSSKICTLIATVSESDLVNIIGSATVPSSGIKKSQVVDIDGAVKAITAGVEAAERMAGYSISSAFVGVGGTNISCQNSHGVVAVAEPQEEIKVEDVSRVTEAARAISLPSDREILHVLPRNFIVDSQEGIKDPIGMTGVRLEVDTHIISGAATTMRNLAKCVSELGIDIEGLVFAGLASSESVLSETEKELGVILIDLGGGTTNVCMFVDGALAHSAVIPVGARNITADLAIGLRVSLDSAEKIKLFFSQPPKTVAQPKEENKTKGRTKNEEIDLSPLNLSEEIRTVSRKTLFEGIIKPRLTEIFSLVEMEIKKSGFAGLTPAGAVLCGGGAKTVGAVETCKKILAMPVHVGSPQKMTGLIDEVSSCEFATSVGIVLYGARQERARGGFGKKLPLSKNQLSKIFAKAINFIKSFLP